MVIRIRLRQILINPISPTRIIPREHTCYPEKRTVQKLLLTHFLLLLVCLLSAHGERLLLQNMYQIIDPGLEEYFGSLLVLCGVCCKLGILLIRELEYVTHYICLLIYLLIGLHIDIHVWIIYVFGYMSVVSSFMRDIVLYVKYTWERVLCQK